VRLIVQNAVSRTFYANCAKTFVTREGF